MIKLALYGKGGIGKSTTAANLSAALSKKGLRVMQIGCDPKADSTQNLCGGRKISTVLDILKEKGMETRLEDVVAPGFNGICCVEAGGPTPGIGCAGRGIITAFETLERLNAYEVYLPDVVLYLSLIHISAPFLPGARSSPPPIPTWTKCGSNRL